jgi:hypothetical protein
MGLGSHGALDPMLPRSEGIRMLAEGVEPSLVENAAKLAEAQAKLSGKMAEGSESGWKVAGNSQDVAGNFLQEDLAIYAEAQVFAHKQSIAQKAGMVYK